MIILLIYPVNHSLQHFFLLVNYVLQLYLFL
nr:MAG TPA: hypothetical protein [Caudoviricetes sp.]